MWSRRFDRAWAILVGRQAQVLALGRSCSALSSTTTLSLWVSLDALIRLAHSRRQLSFSSSLLHCVLASLT